MKLRLYDSEGTSLTHFDEVEGDGKDSGTFRPLDA